MKNVLKQRRLHIWAGGGRCPMFSAYMSYQPRTIQQYVRLSGIINVRSTEPTQLTSDHPMHPDIRQSTLPWAATVPRFIMYYHPERDIDIPRLSDSLSFTLWYKGGECAAGLVCPRSVCAPAKQGRRSHRSWGVMTPHFSRQTGTGDIIWE